MINPTAPATIDDTDGMRSADSGKTIEAKDLKKKTAKGALVSAVGQGTMFFLRIGSMVIMARLLVPEEFGLVGMVAAVTGFLGLFKDAGLSMATVQRESVTQAETSSLFWINLGVGIALALLCALLAPALARFYHEPRLLPITLAFSISFIFNGAGAQHRAILLRGMRFSEVMLIEIVSLVISIAASVAAALAGLGYWALLVMAVTLPALNAAGSWLATRWVPDSPRFDSDIRSMLQYGGTLTLNSVIVYLAYNAEKVLLGKFFGAEVLGLYGRAYQLINLPTENLNSTIGQVAFPALARVQNDPVRLRNYFLKGYSLFLSLVMPITMGCAVFSADIVRLFLGRQWDGAASVFRLLAPTIIAFALINPFAWLMLATGKAGRSLKISLMIAPVVILGYLVGLSSGPEGVAIGYSSAMMLLVFPMIIWAKHGTQITLTDVLKAITNPTIAIIIAVLVVFLTDTFVAEIDTLFLRVVVENLVLFGVYSVILLFILNQKVVYLSLLRDAGLLRGR